MRLIPEVSTIPTHGVLRRSMAVAVILLTAAACGADAGPSASPEQAASPPDVTLATPPEAALAAEGGDPVPGQLGSYVWGDQGSDSGWLPGAPITVAANEPMLVTLRPPVDVTDWRARYVPAGRTDPAGAASLGQGTGRPAFSAPAPGRWTMELSMTFDGAGDAAYFWRLDVR